MSTTARRPDSDMRRIEVLVQALEACPSPAAREGARELVRALLDLHAAGLARMLDLAGESGEPGRDLVARFGQDGLVSNCEPTAHRRPFADSAS
jgi:hypothetical protein